MSNLKVLAFDLFGTVFNMDDVPREEMQAYGGHIRKPWSPLKLPDSWQSLKAHKDAFWGISNLRESFTVVTMSNAPIALQSVLSRRNGLEWDALIPLEMAQVFKPNPKAYMLICSLMNVEPQEVCMVTANATFGDIEAASGLGMMTRLIRTEECPTIKTLAESL